MPSLYRAEVLLAPTPSNTGGRNVSLGRGSIGSLVSLANSTSPLTDKTDQYIAILKSRQFIWGFVAQNDLMATLFADEWDSEKGRWIETDSKKQPTKWDAYRKLVNGNMLSVNKDRETGLVSIGIEWTDGAIAAQWANRLVAQLNDYLSKQAIQRSERNLRYLNEELERTQIAEIRQTIYRLIGEEQKSAMLANTQKEFAFRVLDGAAEPDRRFSPNRALMFILAALSGGVLAIMCVVLRLLHKVQQQGQTRA